MNSTYLHLVLAHFPIIGIIIGVVILSYGLFYKKNILIKTSFVIFVACALMAIPVFLTGDGAANVVKNLPGVSEKLIKIHEELAEKVIWFIEVLGVFSLIGLFLAFKADKRFKTVCVIILIFSLTTSVLIIKVGSTGGQIRHSEIRTAYSKSLNK